MRTKVFLRLGGDEDGGEVPPTVELDVEEELGLDVLRVQLLSLTLVDGISPAQLRVQTSDGNLIADDQSLRELFTREGPPPILFVGLHSNEEVSEGGLGEEVVDWGTICTRVYFGGEHVEQPMFVNDKNGSPMCLGCALACGSVLPVRPVVTSGGTSSAFCCQCHPCLFQERHATLIGAQTPGMRRRLLALSVEFREDVKKKNQDSMLRRLKEHWKAMFVYEDEVAKAVAVSLMPLDEWERETEEKKEKQGGGDMDAEWEMFVLMMHWFKHKFFRWVNAPSCSACKAATRMIGMAAPNAEERAYRAGRVELYECTQCKEHTRFPRINDARRLLETRCGRCGEWAQAFVLCCRALGWETRHVVDWTDHVWTEVMHNGKWTHCDPCEDIRDAPLVYESGWKKKLTYIIAFSKDEIVDVTRRYTRLWTDVLQRRTIVEELWLEYNLRKLNQSISSAVKHSEVEAKELEERRKREMMDLSLLVGGGGSRESSSRAKQEEKRDRISGNE
jgi:hypothetical protein